MKKRMFLFLMLIALCLTSFAQQEEIKVIGTDTFATVKVQRLKEANAKDVELKGCKEENDSLFSQSRICRGLVNNLRSSVLDFKITNQLSQKIIEENQSVISFQEEVIVKSKRQIKWLKLQRWAFIGGIVLLTGKIIL